jgi:ribosomal-protein-alanine N-acetyltransferase
VALAREPYERGVLEDLEFARMRRRHLRRVLSIEARVYPRPWSASLFLSELSQKATRSYVVAKHAGEVVGYVGMMYAAHEAHVTNIAVDPDFQGHRVGTRLLHTAILEALARGCHTLSLEVRVSNVAAQMMYEKFGFVTVGRRKGYYIETNEDAFIMTVDDALSNEYRLRLQAIRAEIEELSRGG